MLCFPTITHVGVYVDVWSSVDGVSWNRLTALAPWSARVMGFRGTAVTRAGRILLMGHTSNIHRFRDMGWNDNQQYISFINNYHICICVVQVDILVLCLISMVRAHHHTVCDTCLQPSSTHFSIFLFSSSCVRCLVE